MTDIQKKLMELLIEIDDICKREKIKYYLCDETAHGAVVEQRFHKNCYRANIAMTSDAVLKFAEAVKKEKRADRVLDSMLSNKHYPDFSLCYGDVNTTMMELPCTMEGKLPYISVKIHVIRYKPQTFGKYYKLTKSFWDISHMKADEYSTFYKKAAITGCTVTTKIVGEKNTSRMLFKTWCSLFKPNKKSKKLAMGMGKYNYDSSLLKQQNGIAVLEGREFPVFGQVEEYLNKRYSCEDYREIKPKYPVPSASLMISSHIPYAEYMEKAKAMGVDFDAISHNKKECSKLEKKVGEYNKKITKYYAVVDRTEKRFAMYEKYMPMKNLLVKLYKEERFEELNELLKPYRSALWTCYKKGLGLCFDKDIFDITMHLLSMEGSDVYVKKLRDMVPESHWEPMVVTDYKGELVEIKDISEVLPAYTGMKGESLS